MSRNFSQHERNLHSTSKKWGIFLLNLEKILLCGTLLSSASTTLSLNGYFLSVHLLPNGGSGLQNNSLPVESLLLESLKPEVVQVFDVVVGLGRVVHQLLGHAADVHLVKNGPLRTK